MLVNFLAVIFALPGKVFSKMSHEDRILNIRMSLTITLVIEGAQTGSSRADSRFGSAASLPCDRG